MQVARWGNSLAIRIPAAVARSLDLKVGDEVNLVDEGSGTMRVERKPSRAELIARLRATAIELPENWKMTRDEMNARGPDFE